MASLQGRHALVTGGGRGIGRAIAAALTPAGAVVTVVGRSEKPLTEAVGKGEAAGYVVADVTDAKAVDGGVKQAVAARGPIELLVANAGARRLRRRSPRPTPDQFRGMFELNVMGVVHRGAGRARRHGRARLRPHRRGRLDRRPARATPTSRPTATAKHAVVGLGAFAGGRDREDRRHRQCGLPGLYRHRSDARQRRADQSTRPAEPARRRSRASRQGRSRSAG